MTNKSQTKGSTSSTPAEPFNAFSQLQEAGLGNLMGMGTAWVEAISDMGAEVTNFIAERITEDVKTQHEILHCKKIADLQQIQAGFIKKAIEQYQVETGKLVEMGTQALASSTDTKKN